MIESKEDELRERFTALRREDAAGLPPFSKTVAAARGRRAAPGRGRLLVLATAAALVVAALVFVFRGHDRPHMTIDLAAVRLHAPTDFLLKLPGADLLRTVPRLGRVSLDRRTL